MADLSPFYTYFTFSSPFGAPLYADAMCLLCLTFTIIAQVKTRGVLVCQSACNKSSHNASVETWALPVTHLDTKKGGTTDGES